MFSYQAILFSLAEAETTSRSPSTFAAKTEMAKSARVVITQAPWGTGLYYETDMQAVARAAEGSIGGLLT